MRLGEALRRPGMCGGETASRLLVDLMAFIDGVEDGWRRELTALHDRGAATGSGVRGAFAGVLPGYRDDGAVASVYAEIAWRFGWLTVDRTLADAEHRAVRDGAAAWCARDRGFTETMAEAGTPSMIFRWIEPALSEDRDLRRRRPGGGVRCMHFGNTHDWAIRGPQPEPRLVLLAVRHGGGMFAETFTFTPAGIAGRGRL